MKCPNCGHEWAPARDKPVREQVVKLFTQGLSITQIAHELYAGRPYQVAWPEQNVTLHLIKAGLLQRNPRYSHAKRNEAIYNAREKGATFTSLGAKWGISPTRVRDIYHKQMRVHESRRVRRGDYNPDTTTVGEASEELPTRVSNGLKNEGLSDVTLREAAKLTDSYLLRVPGFGLKSLQQWRDFLTTVGLR